MITKFLNSEGIGFFFFELAFLLLEMHLFPYLVALMKICLVRTSSRIRMNVTEVKVYILKTIKMVEKSKEHQNKWKGIPGS